MTDLTAAALRALIHYEPATGVFTWLRRPERTKYDRAWNTRFAGHKTGTHSGNGAYLVIKIFDRLYYAHRLAFLYMTGRWPIEADHRDGNGLNNAWANLREATRTQNQTNTRPRSTHGKGVSCCQGRYVAQITIARKTRYLGSFGTAEEAHAAYVKAAHEAFGDFARTA